MASSTFCPQNAVDRLRASAPSAAHAKHEQNAECQWVLDWTKQSKKRTIEYTENLLLMEKTGMTKLTVDQLKSYSKEDMIALVMQMQEALAVSKAKQFGRKSETMECLGQVSLFNEVELYADVSAPEATVKKPHGKKKTGKQKENVSRLPVDVQNHELSEEELISVYGENGWQRLPDKVYLKVEYLPSQQKCVEHHIAVYAGVRKEDQQKIVMQAPHPVEVIEKSLATASLIACIMNMKYVNAIPLYRIEQEFARNDLFISRANMANWMIYSTDHYFGLVYDLLKDILCKQHVVQADETTCTVVRDDRPAGTKSYMHVYRTNEFQKDRQIVLYKYSPGRGHNVAAEFLKGFEGYLETDAFSGYKALEKEQAQITAAFCWAHARRDFADALKAAGVNNQTSVPQEESVAAQALVKIAEIYHLEGALKDLSPEERLRHRQEEIAPLVEAYFTWVKAQNPMLIGSKRTRDGLAYSLNQEKQLRMFLQDGEIPIDNSASERAIRPFTVGRKNWMMLNTPKGAQSSAILYSIAETAKANNLKPYEYFRFLLDEIPQHLYGRKYDPNDRVFLIDLLPWSDKLPDICKKKA